MGLFVYNTYTLQSLHTICIAHLKSSMCDISTQKSMPLLRLSGKYDLIPMKMLSKFVFKNLQQFVLKKHQFLIQYFIESSHFSFHFSKFLYLLITTLCILLLYTHSVCSVFNKNLYWRSKSRERLMHAYIHTQPTDTKIIK